MSKTTVFFILIILLNFTRSAIFEPNNSSKEANVIIKRGMNLDDVTESLYSKEIIKNPTIFKLWVKINFLEKKIKSGEFVFNANDSVFSVCKKIVNGDIIFRKLTIFEGSYKYDLLKNLREIDPNTILSYEDIPDTLVADTYSYQVTDSAERILNEIKKISDDFSLKIWLERNNNIPLKSIDEVFILASVVEMETSLKKEKPVISGVFYNRLNKNMRLQSDPTVVYSLTMGRFKLGRKLSRKDLKNQSPYNTYVNKGLPPSIICFPGKDSLLSTTQPFKSELLYFVAKNSNGEHYFSTNYKDHLKNIKAAREK